MSDKPPEEMPDIVKQFLLHMQTGQPIELPPGVSMDAKFLHMPNLADAAIRKDAIDIHRAKLSAKILMRTLPGVQDSLINKMRDAACHFLIKWLTKE